MAGQATYREDLPLVMNRKGYDEQTWFTFSYSPVRDESGRVAGMFCACSETTQKVLAAARALRELNETLERRVTEALAERKILADIVEGTDAFVQVADLDYRWLAINRRRPTSSSASSASGPGSATACSTLLAEQPEHQAAVQAVWSRALAGEEFTAIDEFGDPARDRRFYEMRFNTLRDRDGNRIGAYQFVYDVTERLRDQERLRQGRGGAAAGAEDGIARPADRRRRARLQQPAGGVRERPAAAGAQRQRQSSASASSKACAAPSRAAPA